MAWVGNIGLRGQNGRIANMAFVLQVDAVLPADQYAQAVGLLNDIYNKLVGVTAATVAYQRVSNTYNESSANGGGDVFEKATVSVHIGQTGEAEKFATINVPAPNDGIFVSAVGSGRDVVNVGSTKLADYVGALAAGTLISDGEEINTALGAGGIDSGRRTLARVKLA